MFSEFTTSYTLKQVARDLVLVVDDEPALLLASAIAIALAGFRAAAAEDGAAGLAVFLQRRDEICLVISDIMMPVMNGIEMAERILQVEPHTKILLMSAYSNDVIGRQVRNRFPFIHKPFVRSMFIEKVRSMVGVQELTASAT
jgi:DNA-binding NtrC family response regulator